MPSTGMGPGETSRSRPGPHAYVAPAGAAITDWAGRPAAPCAVCQLSKRNTIHRRRRRPAAPTPRAELLADAWRARDAAVLGEHDDQEN